MYLSYIDKKGNVVQYHYNEKTSNFLKNAKNFVGTNRLSAKKYNDGKQQLVIVYLSFRNWNSLNTVTTPLKSNINVGNAKTVRLGFSNITFKNIFGYAGSLPPSWSNVSK